MQVDTSAAWQQREEVRKSLHRDPNNDKNLEKVRRTDVVSSFVDRSFEIHVQEGDQAGFFGHLKTITRKETESLIESKVMTVIF